MADYADKYAEKKLKKMEIRINSIYRSAFHDAYTEQQEYWQNLEKRVRKQYEAYQKAGKSKEEWNTWVRNQIGRGKTLDVRVKQIAERLTESNQIAVDYINGVTPSIFKECANFEAFQLENAYAVTSFTLVDDEALKAVMTGNQVEFKAKWKELGLDPVYDYEWNRSKVEDQIYQAILRGEGMKDIADRMQNITNSNRVCAMRNARTAVGSAQNAGRQATFEKASAMGIEIIKEWKSFHDTRTRDSHAHLDGIRVKYDEKFPNGLMYPKDPDGEPAEVYNCRCTMGRIKTETEQRTANDIQTYRKWLREKEQNNG